MLSVSRYSSSLQIRLLAVLGVICVALVAGAVAIQVLAVQDPCPLCIVLRYLFLVIALSAFLGAAFHRRWARVAAASVILPSAIGGAAVSGRLVYLEFNPYASCGRDVVQLWTDAIPLAQWWPTVFQATGVCGAAYPPILGLSLAEWSLISFVLIVFGVLAGITKLRG